MVEREILERVKKFVKELKKHGIKVTKVILEFICKADGI